MAPARPSLVARSHSRWRFVVPALAVWLTLIALPVVALAAPTITLTPNTGPRCVEVVIVGSGFPANVALKILVESAPGRRDQFGEARTAADGTFRFAFTTPAAAPAGTVEFVIVSATDMTELARAKFTLLDDSSRCPQVRVEPPSGPAGTRFTVSGRGFQPGAELLYGGELNGQDVILGRMRIAADGTFTSSFDSSAIPPGEYELVVATGPNVRPLALTRFTITAPATPGLPNTGGGGMASRAVVSRALLGSLGVVALAVLVAGVVGRRRAV